MWPLSYPTRRACRYAACVSGVLHTWDFALYLAGNDSHRDNILPSGLPTGALEEASAAWATSISTRAGR